VAGGLQALVRQIDPDLPITDVRSMAERLSDSLLLRRSPALLSGLFAGFALLLTVIGTYGVLSYALAQRRREIGLRMALGARREQVRRQFVWTALRLVAAGTCLGLVGARRQHVLAWALESVMANLSVRKIDDEVYERLKARAVEHGVSTEEEVRRILRQAVSAPKRLGELAVRLFGPDHGIDLEPQPRPPHEALDLGG
jgi:plasmid stability protein